MKTLGIMDGFGEVDVRYGICGQCSCKLHRGCRKIGADVFVVGTMGKSGTETGGKFHGGGADLVCQGSQCSCVRVA